MSYGSILVILSGRQLKDWRSLPRLIESVDRHYPFELEIVILHEGLHDEDIAEV